MGNMAPLEQGKITQERIDRIYFGSPFSNTLISFWIGYNSFYLKR